MTSEPTSTVVRLIDRAPAVTGEEIAASLVPPPQFTAASFASYRPDPDYPSQQDAVTALRRFAGVWTPSRPSGLFGWRKKRPEPLPGVYLDGGFGVGKTHLLAALWHEAPAPAFYGTFIEYTALVGALGYGPARALLTGSQLVCVDEFELDDPGDTMMMTRLLTELMASGTRVAATSNTPPGALGVGRFAAEDFLREIQALSSTFEIIRIDGLDYRRRAVEDQAPTLDPAEFDAATSALMARGRRVSVDDFDGLVAHLASLHPSRYTRLLDGVDAIGLTDVHELHDQARALRFVAFVDRVYDAQIPLLTTGRPANDVFDAEMLRGGYRKKYLRASSRLLALASGDLPPADG